MFVIMCHDEYLQENSIFDRQVESVMLFNNGNIAERIAKKLKAEVISIRKLLREKVLILDRGCRFQFERALNRATEAVSKWPEWKQNCLDDNPTVKVPRLPVINGEQSDGW